MGSLNDFLRKINNVTRGVNNITGTVSRFRASVRSAQPLIDKFRGKKKSRPSAQLSGSGSVPQPQRKPLGLTPVSQVSSGRNANKRPVRPAPRTDVGPKIR